MMSPATSTQIRRRHAARRRASERQRQLNEERRQRDELELELAADFALALDECATAKEAVLIAEAAMGRLVDRMVGELRVRYPRAAQLLEIPEDELRRLRQLATEPATRTGVSRSDARTLAIPSGEIQHGEEGQRSLAGATKSGQSRARRAGPVKAMDDLAASTAAPD